MAEDHSWVEPFFALLKEVELLVSETKILLAVLSLYSVDFGFDEDNKKQKTQWSYVKMFSISVYHCKISLLGLILRPV